MAGINVKYGNVAGGQVARVTIDNQARLNSLDADMIDELRTLFEGFSDNEELRVVVLTGAGDRAFCGGADLDSLADLTADNAAFFITKLHHACAAIRNLPVPVIGRVAGFCLGAGLEVAASCDFRAAETEAKFAMPEVRVGVPSVIEAALLPRLIGIGRTNRLLLTGDTIDAEEALMWGLVEKVVAIQRLDEVVDGWIASICDAGPNAIRLQKELNRNWQNQTLDEGITAGIDAFAEAYKTDEPQQQILRLRGTHR